VVGQCFKPPGAELGGSHVPFGSTATHEPARIPKSVWKKWKSPDINKQKQISRDKRCGDSHTEALLLGALVSFSADYALELALPIELGNMSSWAVLVRLDTSLLQELEKWVI